MDAPQDIERSWDKNLQRRVSIQLLGFSVEGSDPADSP
jgi:hypothetical protein